MSQNLSLKEEPNKVPASPRYNAEIVAGALMISESRQIARQLLDGVTNSELKKLLVEDNILQKRSPSTALRQAALIKKRLQLVNGELLGIIANGTREVATQSLLATAIKHNKLLGDFMLRVVKEHWLAYEKQLKRSDWPRFLEECQHIDPTVLTWSKATRQKIGQVVVRCLIEARYVDSARSLQITPVHIYGEVLDYLRRNDEQYVLTCMEIFDER
ncbi:MAG: DUF1819 family protein [Pyrinomonadaceae bacterium]